MGLFLNNNPVIIIYKYLERKKVTISQFAPLTNQNDMSMISKSKRKERVMEVKYIS